MTGSAQWKSKILPPFKQTSPQAKAPKLDILHYNEINTIEINKMSSNIQFKVPGFYRLPRELRLKIFIHTFNVSDDVNAYAFPKRRYKPYKNIEYVARTLRKSFDCNNLWRAQLVGEEVKKVRADWLKEAKSLI